MPQINFDIKAAKKAGASNKDIAEYFKSNYKIDFDFEQAATSGVSDDDVISYINQNYGSVKKKDNTASSDTPSQLPKISQVSKEGTKKDNAYFKQIAVGIKPSAQGNVVERIYENPMGVEVLQVEPKKRELAPKQPVQKAETKDKPLRGVKPIAPTNSELNEQGWLLNMVSALDKGVYKTLGTTAQGAGTLLQGVTSKITGGTGEGFVSDALIKFGDSYNKMIDELTPQDESFKGSLSDQVGQALGFVGGLALTGGASSAARGSSALIQQAPKSGSLASAVKELVKGTVSPTGVVGGLTMGQAEFDRAKQAGATDEQAFEAFYKNAAVGSVLERIPVMHFLKRFNNATAGGVLNYIKTKGVAGLTGGVEEMTTEMLQQLYANKTAKDIYNTNQDLFEGVVGNGTIGFSVGFLLNAMGANAKILRKQGKVNEAKLVENQVKELQEKAKGVAPTNNAITTKIAVNGNEEGLQRTQAELDNDLQKGLISEEEYQEKAAIAQKAAEVNVKIPDYVEGANRAESIELINEREALQQELMQKEEQKKSIDVAYHKSIDESNKEVQKRIDEINNQLGELAKPEKNKVEEEITPPTDKQIEDDLKNNRLVTFEYNSESEIPDVFKDKVSSKGENNGVEFFRVTLPESVANYELNKLNKQDKEVVVEEEIQQPIEVSAKPNPIDEQSIAASQKWIKDLYSLPDFTRIQDKNGNVYDIKDSKIRKLTLDKEGNILDAEIIHTDRDIHKRGSYANPDFFNEGYKVLPEQPIQQIPDENIQPPIEEQPQGEIVEAVRVEQEPEAKESKSTNKNFTTHKGEVVTGEKLQSALDEVADDYVKMYNSIRKEDKYASHVTEKQKDDALSKGLDFAEKIRIGDGIDNFTVWQRVNEKITGESVPLFSDKTPKNINKEDANESKPQQIDISGKVQSPKPESKEGSPTSPKPSEEGKGNGSPKEKVGGEPIAEAEPKQEDVEPKTPLEEKYEQINKLRGEKVKELAKQKLISDNFDSIVAQLMTKNKIKRQC
ncbi:MAG: hypothetical protein B7Y37_13880 [Sphingobacteriia bacterium 28-36-52]|nr:MAG: hypothetical protein B7Y37_13880 [Sphingobacteriia bacterium 28-36-52]